MSVSLLITTVSCYRVQYYMESLFVNKSTEGATVPCHCWLIVLRSASTCYVVHLIGVHFCMESLSGQLFHGQLTFCHLSVVVNFDKTIRTNVSED